MQCNENAFKADSLVWGLAIVLSGTFLVSIKKETLSKRDYQSALGPICMFFTFYTFMLA